MCPSCNASWNRVFLYQHFPTDLIKKFNQNRAAVLWATEQSKLPETSEYAGRLTKIQSLSNEIAELRKQIRNKMAQVTVLRQEGDDTSYETKRKFILRCGAKDCNGFVSTQYKCHICEEYTCKTCHEIKQDPHDCDPRAVESVKLIKESTITCPGEGCGAQIFKISGCPQMWCTQCHTAFDYGTGKKVTGVIHNPHYFAAKRSGLLKGPAATAALCGGYPYSVQPILLRLLQQGLEFQDMVLRPAETAQAAPVNLDLRCKFLNKQIDKEHMVSTLIRRDKVNEKNREIFHIYQLMNVCLIEHVTVANQCLRLTNPVLKQHLDEINQVRQLCNQQLIALSDQFGQVVLTINPNFRVTKYKKNLKPTKYQSGEVELGRCNALTRKGEPCKHRSIYGHKTCSIHRK